MTIKVTQKHIDDGERDDPCRCPIALAMRECEQLVRFGPLVGHHYVGLTGDKYHEVQLPVNAIEFISNFDYNYSVSPFEFEFYISGVE